MEHKHTLSSGHELLDFRGHVSHAYRQGREQLSLDTQRKNGSPPGSRMSGVRTRNLLFTWDAGTVGEITVTVESTD